MHTLVLRYLYRYRGSRSHASVPTKKIEPLVAELLARYDHSVTEENTVVKIKEVTFAPLNKEAALALRKEIDHLFTNKIGFVPIQTKSNTRPCGYKILFR